MKNLILIAFLLTSYFVSFGQTKLVIDRKDGKKDSIEVNTISQISFTSSGIYEPSLFEVVTVLDSAQSKFIEYANLTNGDFTRTIDLTEYWLMTQPNVQSTFSMGDGYIYITLKSGLKTTFYFNEVDDEGYSIYRGGEGGSSLNAANAFIENAAGILSKNVIENKKVLLFETDIVGLKLEPQIKIITDLLNKSDVNLKVTVLRNEQCTVEAVETFRDYGLVIIDGHGMISTFELGKEIDFTDKPKTEESVKNEIKTQLGPSDASKVSSGVIELAASVKGNPQKTDWVKSIKKEDSYTTNLSGKYIATLPPMPKTIIFGNMCYSGWILTSINIPERKVTLPNKTVVTVPAKTETFENPVGKAFIERNLISYYGFTRNEFVDQDNTLWPRGSSRSVPNWFSMLTEEQFVKRLAIDKDSTGIANLEPDNKTEYIETSKPLPFTPPLYGDLFFRHYGADNYSYPECNEPLKDERDGRIYKTVCIGKQVWMAENLAWLPSVSPSSVASESAPLYYVYGYEGSTLSALKTNINYIAYGALYNWEAAKTACPAGWHLPTDAEWTALADFLGTSASDKMKETGTAHWINPNANATNSSGFTALPGGISNPKGGFGGLGSYAYFWTSTARESDAWGRFLEFNNSGVSKSGSNRGTGMSVRCIKDKDTQ
jgi:uncharacterized protein (TIGR02145 family)